MKPATKQQHTDYQVVPYPKTRRWEAASFRTVRHKAMMHGLLEIDVTEVRARLREHKVKTGEALSFTAFLITCLAKAVDENKAVQAYRQGGKRLIVFEDVDVYTPIEHEMAGQKQVFPSVIRAANRKTLREIHREVRAAKMRDTSKAMNRLRFLPAILYQPYLWILTWKWRRDPRAWKKDVGTVGITAVGMFGEGTGWGIPIPPPVLMITVGGIGEKPGGVDGQIVMREYLSLTISFDHEVIDGAPAARFTRRLKELIESGYGLDGLDDFRIESAQAEAEGASQENVVATSA